MFLKFGNETNLKDLYENGTIYMNPIQYFRKIEDKELRGDSYEGASEIINYPSGEFEIPAIRYKGSHLGIHLKMSFDEVLGNIYSLYCISSNGWKNPEDFFVDQKIKQFGTHCLMVKDNVKFLNLVEKKLDELKVEYHHGFIKYYDKKNINRKVSLFEKPNEFEYQKEFRFYIPRESSEPFSFSIGSLKNIAELVNANDLIDTAKLIKNND